MENDVAKVFSGFETPEQNWSRMPHGLIGQLPVIDSLSELKVILYILRHTWGYQEFDTYKKITLDEFEHGRMRSDRTRMDTGTGMSKSSILRGLNNAEEHGFILVETNDKDKARIKKTYRINTLDVSQRDSERPIIEHRTEKDTIEEKQDRDNDLFWEEKSAEWKESRKEVVRTLPEELLEIIESGTEDPLANWPVDVTELLGVYVKVAKHRPIKSDKADWIKTARVWKKMGVTKQDVSDMHRYAIERWDIARPGSITNAYRMMKSNQFAQEKAEQDHGFRKPD